MVKLPGYSPVGDTPMQLTNKKGVIELTILVLGGEGVNFLLHLLYVIYEFCFFFYDKKISIFSRVIHMTK